jgi:hypothetical protein
MVFLHDLADVISSAQTAPFKGVQLLLRSSRVISNLPIFILPGDTTGDTKISTLFVTGDRDEYTRERLCKTLRLQLGDEIADLRLALTCPLSSVRMTRRVFGSAGHSESDRTLDRAGAAQE